MKSKSLLILFLTTSVMAFSQKKSLMTIAKADSLLFAGDPKSAKEIYGKILKDTTKNAGAWSRYGLSNLNLKNYEEAIRLFHKALIQRPPQQVRMNTYAGLARAYSAFNNNTKAVACLDSAAKLGYVNLKLVDTHDDFKNIRGEQQFKKIREQIYINLNPCMTNAKAREFDFWIGDWNVYVTGTKNYAGHNKIEMSSGGCALLENWDSNASSGKSLNFIDPATGKWRQTWVGSYPNGIQDFTDGEYKDGAMRFIFETTDAKGNKVIGRFIFYNEKPGQVRQFNETSADNGKTWVTSYDFTYFRKN
jgi:tetratricopeptide (TPR) repeat protein